MMRPRITRTGEAPRERIDDDKASPNPGSARKRVRRLAPTAIISKADVVMMVSSTAIRCTLPEGPLRPDC